MMPHCKSDFQTELFVELHSAELAPKLALPIQQKAVIDVSRVAKILGVRTATVRRMAEDHRLVGYKVHDLAAWRIEYDSVVEYCNRLRLQYGISSRIVPPPPGRRHRDEDLLPFPLAESLSASEVSRILDCKYTTVIHLIEEGKLIGYQIALNSPQQPWRIYRRSLERYIDSLHQMTANSRSSHRSRSAL